MCFPEERIRPHLYGQPCNMRKSFDGLQALVRHGLPADPTDGGLCVFINRRATQMPVLYFDRSGFCIWAKRLEGIEPIRVRKRYRLPRVLQNTPSNTS